MPRRVTLVFFFHTRHVDATVLHCPWVLPPFNSGKITCKILMKGTVWCSQQRYYDVIVRFQQLLNSLRYICSGYLVWVFLIH